ncbi:hypothetical protein [Halorhabdus rudnickae]|uniref:hypothetical protein n=1 Tax=Halorhabdus rudnickae TaxID=1775544 RepID=UPI0010842C85|nr:hypothetical protein [Halorhabdus rudnickae]
MAEDERTVEQPSETVDSGESGSPATVDEIDTERNEADASTDAARNRLDADEAIARFYELDEDFDRPPGGASGEPRRAIVTDAEQVDEGEIPETYPLEGDPAQAIALTLDFGTETATAYLALPGGDRETGLTRLLDALDVELRGLYGETVLVERQGVHTVIVTPEETPRGSDRRPGILVGMGIVATFVGILSLVPDAATVSASAVGPSDVRHAARSRLQRRLVRPDAQ